jgi:hypothetical protein
MRPLKILFTNNTLDSRGGTELWVRDMAMALRKRGHAVAVYSSLIGPVGREMLAGGISVVDDIEQTPWTPDLLHLHHHLEAMTAIVRFPSTPAVFICHGAVPWEEEPIVHPSVRRWLAVDFPSRERLLGAGAPAERTTILPNFVDTDRFSVRAALPARPRRALVFSNQVSEANVLRDIRKGARAESVAVDAAGIAAGNVLDRPELHLGTYDLVFAKGRAAMEAMATGCAVVLCDALGVGPYVRSEDVAALRDLNFGIRTLITPVSKGVIAERLRSYDASDVPKVTRWIRENASLDRAATRLEAIYCEVLAERAAPADDSHHAAAVARYLRSVSRRVKYHEGIRHERDLMEARLRKLAIRRFLFRR